MTTKNIHEANLAEVRDLSETSAEFVIKPLYYGYGNTLGNSLRRVLLSSVKGAAITAFSIEGTTHEFTAIPGIREDVVDIMLNLKNIRFKMHTDNPVELTLEMKGAITSTRRVAASMSLSLAMIRRRLWRSPFFANVINFSRPRRISFARARVVVIDWYRIREHINPRVSASL